MIPVLTLIGPWYIAFRELGLYDTRAALIAHPRDDQPADDGLADDGLLPRDPARDSRRRRSSTAAVRSRRSGASCCRSRVPGLIAAGILAFIFSWNEFADRAQPDVARNRDGSGRIARFAQQYEVQHAQMAAASVISTIPAILLMFLGQRFIVRGLTLGSVK